MNKSEKIKFLLECSLFASSLIYYIKNKKMIRKQLDFLNFIKNAYIFSPHILLEIIKRGDSKAI